MKRIWSAAIVIVARGQKVTVTSAVTKRSMDGGVKNELDTLTVGSLKVVGKACK